MSDRPAPRRRRRRRACPTRAPPCTSPGTRSTPTTWCTAPATSCTPTRSARRTPTPGSPASRRRRAWPSTGVVRVLTADDVPGVNDAGVKHDEPLFPDEVMFLGHAVCWVLGETLEAARLGRAPPSRSTTSRCRRWSRSPRRSRPASFQGGRPVVARGDVEAASRGAAHVFSGDTEMAGQEHFYLETHAALALVDEAGQVFVQSSTQHPTETQEIVAHVLGLAQPRRHRAVPADGRRLRRQGDAAARLRRGRGARRHAHRPSGPAPAQPHAGHDDDRQAPRLPRPVAGRLRRRRPAAGARGHPHLRRRLEPRPERAGAGPGAVPRRQRLLDPARPPPRPGRPHPQDLADRVPRLRRAAGDAGDRGRPRPVRARCSGSTRSSCGAATSTSRARRRPTASRSATPDRIAARLGPGARHRRRGRAGGARSRRSTPPTSTPSAAWRSRR